MHVEQQLLLQALKVWVHEFPLSIALYACHTGYNC